MKSRLEIDLMSLPEEGKGYAGQLEAEIFDLPEGDARAVGPLEYDLHAQRFGSELLLTGKLSAPFEFTCVVTLQPFVKTIDLEDAAVSLEIENEGVIDVTEAIREEVLIQFPIDPRCDEADEPMECQIDLRYLAVDKPIETELRNASRVQSDDRWSALDNLKDLKGLKE